MAVDPNKRVLELMGLAFKLRTEIDHVRFNTQKSRRWWAGRSRRASELLRRMEWMLEDQENSQLIAMRFIREVAEAAGDSDTYELGPRMLDRARVLAGTSGGVRSSGE